MDIQQYVVMHHLRRAIEAERGQAVGRLIIKTRILTMTPFLIVGFFVGLAMKKHSNSHVNFHQVA